MHKCIVGVGAGGGSHEHTKFCEKMTVELKKRLASQKVRDLNEKEMDISKRPILMGLGNNDSVEQGTVWNEFK